MPGDHPTRRLTDTTSSTPATEIPGRGPLPRAWPGISYVSDRPVRQDGQQLDRHEGRASARVSRGEALLTFQLLRDLQCSTSIPSAALGPARPGPMMIGPYSISQLDDFYQAHARCEVTTAGGDALRATAAHRRRM